MIFSCEDAAQQDLMSVCLCVSVCVVNLKKCLSTSFYNIQMFQNVSESMQNIPESFRMHAESYRMFMNACRKFQSVQECSRMTASRTRLPIVRAKMDSVSNIIQRAVAQQITYTSFIRGYGLGR